MTLDERAVARIKKLVDEAPPLTDHQRNVIAVAFATRPGPPPPRRAPRRR